MTWREYTKEYPDFPGESVADVLRPLGYRTAFLTTSFLDYVGYDRFLQGRGFDDVLDWKGLGGGEALNSWGGTDDLLVDRTLDWIDRDRGTPFYVVAFTNQTHHPYDPAPGQPIADFFEGGQRPADEYDLGRYLNALAESDRQAGRLLAGLRARGLDRDTVVIVTGDHGEAFGEPHPTWGHGFRLYDENVRVPLMVWSPALVPLGSRVSTVGGHVDLNPTILDLLDVAPSGAWEGRSLFARDRPPRAYFYAANDRYLLGVREGRFKYVYDATHGREELFDLVADPDERVNVASSHAERCRTLRSRLAAWKHHSGERMDRALRGQSLRADLAPPGSSAHR
jgi:arylsulfatase A-like enzyme